ncbi:hypothetical protein [Streptomyces iranensis]|uniref:hypothetical protein n=1 Tax=Streptomyces iranensis TaxID=576784 RepID=UPI0039B74AFF
MTTTHSHETVTGWSGGVDYFPFREYSRLEPSAVVEILRGESVGAVFRGAVSKDTCAVLAERFWTSPYRVPREGGALGHYIGAYHYHKTIDGYLDDSAASAPALVSVLGGTDDPLRMFYDGLARELAPQGVTVRLAEHNGRQACRGVIRSWHASGQYTLEPHEDMSQCTDPRQAGFEIQGVVRHRPVALNICLENGPGGRLAIWNIQPDDASKRRLGAHLAGAPYPATALDGLQMQWVDVRPGDIYVFNGASVHAVEPNVDSQARRTTLSGIFGFIDDSTVVSWT